MNIEQAAILCGGMGKRLRPITNTIPKPMVLVNGRPFLEYLIEQLKQNGIKEVALMTGYLGEKIREHFGNGSAFGVDIVYSHGPVEWETARRLHEAKPLLRDHFLLLYADNFVQFSLNKLVNYYQTKKKLLCFVVQSKANGNIRLMTDGTVEVYDKTRSMQNLGFVELGYMVVDKSIFAYYQDIDVSFSEILVTLVMHGHVAGMIVGDAYHSISDPERLRLTEAYLKTKKILLIDRDGVINRKAPRGEYIARWSDFHFIPDNIRGLKELSDQGFEFIVLSNQAGIGRGILNATTVRGINERMRNALKAEGISILEVYVCPHHWEDNCYCRKPKPGLFFQASRDWLFRLDQTFFIGDDPRDCQAAYNAGSKCVFLGNTEDLGGLSKEEYPHFICGNIHDALPYIMENG
jgi:D-glycero-D-manno-heptose 1,7-bisphosphate phosphatase